MYINVETSADTTGLLSQIEKVKKLATELESETYKLRTMMLSDIQLVKNTTPAERVEPRGRCETD